MMSFLTDCLAIFAVLLTIAGPVIWLRGLFSGNRTERYAGAFATLAILPTFWFMGVPDAHLHPKPATARSQPANAAAPLADAGLRTAETYGITPAVAQP
jgi:hypothetical protein